MLSSKPMFFSDHLCPCVLVEWEGARLLIGTVNLWEDQNKIALRMALAAESIYSLVKKVKPTHYIFGFQEVLIGMHGNPLLVIAGKLGLNTHHVGFCSASRNTQRGVGIVSSGYIGELQDTRLPDDENHPLFFGFRFPGAWEVHFPQGTICALAAHCTVVPHMQKEQAVALTEFAHKARGTKPAIIMVDTNAGVNTEAHVVYTLAWENLTEPLQRQRKVSWPVNIPWIEMMSSDLGNKPGEFLYEEKNHRWMDNIFATAHFRPLDTMVMNSSPAAFFP